LVETDGCVADAISVVTGCWIGRRTMRVIDFGKVAATFVDTRNLRAVRIVPRRSVRERAREYAPETATQWQVQLLGYQRMPEELLAVQQVELVLPLEKLLGTDGTRAYCERCREEIINQREIFKDGLTLCRACAGQPYYTAWKELADDFHADRISAPRLGQVE
jgi:formylmethanofuran dehydrogenase subunit E